MESFLKWIESNLKNRQQQVIVDQSCSRFKSVTTGVPQVSVLGPLVFLIYVNDITENIRVVSIVRLFADDT